MNKITKTLLAIVPAALIAAFPGIVSAQGELTSDGTFGGLITNLQTLLNSLIPLIAVLALVAFFWGLAKYVFQADDEEAQAKGKNIMIGGIVALFLIAAIGGIIQFFADAFGFGQGQVIPTTGIDGTPGGGAGSGS